MGDVSEDMVKDIRKNVVNISKEFGFAGTQAADAYYDAISAGIDKDKAYEFMRDAAKLAVAGNAEIGASTDLLTSALNAFKIDAEDAGMVADIMFNTVKMGKTTIDELGASFSDIGPIASSMNVSLEDSMAWLAQLTLSGTPTAQATTQIKSALVELGREGSKGFKHFQQAAGVTFPKFIEEGGSMAEAFELLTDYSERSGISIGNMFANVRAAQGVIGAAGMNIDSFAEKTFEMAQAAGSTEEAFELMSMGVDFQMGRLRETFNAARVNIGSVLLPVVGKALPKITALVDKVAEADIDGFFKRIKDNIDRTLMPRVTRVRGVVNDWYDNLKQFGREAQTVAGHIRSIAAIEIAKKRIELELWWAGVEEGTINPIHAKIEEWVDETIPQTTKDKAKGVATSFWETFVRDWNEAKEIPDLISDAWENAQEGDFTGAGTDLANAWKAGFQLVSVWDNVAETLLTLIGKPEDQSVLDWAGEWSTKLAEQMGIDLDGETTSEKFDDLAGKVLDLFGMPKDEDGTAWAQSWTGRLANWLDLDLTDASEFDNLPPYVLAYLGEDRIEDATWTDWAKAWTVKMAETMGVDLDGEDAAERFDDLGDKVGGLFDSGFANNIADHVTSMYDSLVETWEQQDVGIDSKLGESAGAVGTAIGQAMATTFKTVLTDEFLAAVVSVVESAVATADRTITGFMIKLGANISGMTTAQFRTAHGLSKDAGIGQFLAAGGRALLTDVGLIEKTWPAGYAFGEHAGGFRLQPGQERPPKGTTERVGEVAGAIWDWTKGWQFDAPTQEEMDDAALFPDSDSWFFGSMVDSRKLAQQSRDRQKNKPKTVVQESDDFWGDVGDHLKDAWDYLTPWSHTGSVAGRTGPVFVEKGQEILTMDQRQNLRTGSGGITINGGVNIDLGNADLGVMTPAEIGELVMDGLREAAKLAGPEAIYDAVEGAY